jgi:hypothetical protein
MMLMMFVMLMVMLRCRSCLGRSGNLLLRRCGDGCGRLCECAQGKQPCEGGNGDLLVHRLYFLKISHD